MKSYASILLTISMLLFVGCSVRIEDPPSPTPSPPVPEQSGEVNAEFDARIAAARSISSFIKRDNALSVIAVDAAHAPDSVRCIKALSLISSFIQCDSAAEKCADIFLQNHMLAEAKKVADHASSFIAKDRILSKIAQTPAGRASA